MDILGQINGIMLTLKMCGRSHKRGITLDRSYKTVRYAADWIEKGANSYEDKYLMEVTHLCKQKLLNGLTTPIANVISI